MIENIYKKLIELSDIELQRKLWLNEHNDTGEISSYVELMNSLFDDYSFDSFVEMNASKAGMSRTVVAELEKLRSILNNYKEMETDEGILNDAGWLEIVNQAKGVIDKWDRDFIIK